MPRFGTFNMENLFSRPVAMNRQDDATGAEALRDFSELNVLVNKPVYSAGDKNRLVQLSLKYGFHKLDQRDPFIRLNKIRGKLFHTDSATGALSVVADGRDDWTGWFDLIREDISWEALFNTGRVVSDVSADILVCVEIEDRGTLHRFNELVLRQQFSEAAAYPHVMLIDGNDARGIDVGVLSRHPIAAIRSHLDERDPANPAERLFSRDCPEYEIDVAGQTVIILANHFKSKRGGDSPSATNRRTRQADGAKAIYQSALQRSSLVLIAGDLNDIPQSQPIQALTAGLSAAERPQDVMTSPLYTDPHPGTYGTGLASGKFDYLFLSPALWSGVTAVGIERRGTYHPQKWPHYDTVTGENNQASDHCLLWADVTV